LSCCNIGRDLDQIVNNAVDLFDHQTREFKRHGGNPICIAIVGVNHAGHVTSYEGKDRPFTTDGRKYKHPIQEAADAIARLREFAAPSFDEFMILRYKATNEAPYAFAWVDENQTAMEYSALLTRVSRDYDRRFA
jgi:hypothetical protein